MARMSNRDRIARAAEEAAAAAADKAREVAGKAKRPASPARRRTAKPVAMKVVWEVYGPTGTTAATFAYPDRAAADAESDKRTRASGYDYRVRAAKVPMV